VSNASYWNAGLTTEGSRAAIDFGFARLGLAQIIALVDLRNAASVRVLEKLEMTAPRSIRGRAWQST
jgi:ribosomal-protein-alanine N-acetyltransferase